MSGRQSLYPSTAPAPSHHVLNYLSSCISSVDLSCRTLESINDHLREQTSDFGRFSKVLSSKKHFDLVSEKEIQIAKAHLSAEIAPQLKQLIMRVETALQNEERRSKTVKAKAAQQSLRLEQLAQLHNIPTHQLTLKSRRSQKPKLSKGEEEVQRLAKELGAVRAEKEEKQREMDRLERELRREAGAARGAA